MSCAFDECLEGIGGVRLHWRALLDTLERLGPEELSLRMENGRHLLAEHGVTCYEGTLDNGMDRIWQCDLLPFVLDAGEWRKLEAGLLQRARLVNLVLQDLYGTQHLVRDGFIPAPLVFANPGYLRPCQAIDVPGGIYLQMYAADLARSPDGKWWVLADRTQAPAGIGFALENRSVVSRILPEALREVRPLSISDTLRIRRNSLRLCAPEGVENPATALLTPGRRNEAYVEHAYLARMLGFALVEGDDLTVRNRQVFVKTLDGLRPVDVMLRCVQDGYCDPLELRADSLLGVPGLVEAARAGHVGVANGLGSGLLEGPAFMAFLPSLCRHILREEILLPSVATWWCGQAGELNFVREHLEQLVIRPAFSLAGPPRRAARLDAGSERVLLEEIQHRPHEFVAQEEVSLSHAPVWGAHEWSRGPLVLRMFVLHDGSTFRVMPGGIARILEEESLSSLNVPLTGLSKDVWVHPGDETEEVVVQSVSRPPVSLERAPSDLPSRAAENFFWLGRYAERLEQSVRVALCTLRQLGEESEVARRERLAVLERLVVSLGLVSGGSPDSTSREALTQELLTILFQEECGTGLRALLKRMQQAAFAVRDRLSGDTWRILNRLEPDSRERPGPLRLVQASSMLHTLILDLAAFSGMETENMTRGHGWAFLDIGRRVERAIFMSRLIEAVVRIDPESPTLLEAALDIGDSTMTHRRRFFAEAICSSVLDVLVHDRSNPRSLMFQLVSLAAHADSLPSGSNPEGVAAVQKLLARLLRSQELVVVPAQVTASEDSSSSITERLAEISAEVERVSELLTQLYFNHVSPEVN